MAISVMRHTTLHTHTALTQICFANNAGFDLAFAVHDCDAGMLSPYTSSTPSYAIATLNQNPFVFNATYGRMW